MKRENREIFRAFSLISQVGISLLVTVFLSIFIGLKIDEKLDTHIFVVAFLALGIAAGLRNIYHLTKVFYSKEKEKEDKELRYFEDLKKGKTLTDEKDKEPEERK